MKRVFVLVISLFLLVNGSVMAHGVNTVAVKHSELTVLVNGVKVVSSANHLNGSKTYVSVKAFAELFNLSFTKDTKSNAIVFNEKTISDLRVKNGETTAWIRDLANAVNAQQVSWSKENQEVYVLVLPAGTIQISESVPAMGEHWSNPQAGDLPLGPIYGVHEGRLVFLEYMVAQDDFEKGINHVNIAGMKGVPSPPVVQMDIEFQSQGHEGFEVPHYDIHAYFISEDEQQNIK